MKNEATAIQFPLLQHESPVRNDVWNMIRQAPVGMCIVSGNSPKVAEVNDLFLQLIGKSREQLYNLTYLDANSEAGTSYVSITRLVWQSGETYHAKEQEMLMIRNGKPEVVYVDFIYQPMKDIDNKVTSIMIVATDVTDRVMAKKSQQLINEEIAIANEEMAAANEVLTATIEELAITQKNLEDSIRLTALSEQKFRNVIQEAPVAIALFSGREFLIEAANPAILAAWGKTESVIGMPLVKAMPELKEQVFLQLLYDVYTTGKPYYGKEVKAMLRHGSDIEEVYSNFVCQPLKNIDNQTYGILLTANLITDQVLARKAVEWGKEQLRMAIDAAELATWYMHTTSGEFIPSKRMKQLFGFYPNEEMPLAYAFEQITEDYREKVKKAVSDTINTGVQYRMEYPVIGLHDRKLRWHKAIGKLYQNDTSGSGNFFGVIIDITETKEDELRKNDFIGMVSHELKTPLTSLNAYIQMLESRAKKNNDTFTTESLSNANKQVRKMTTMINNFLNVSRLESSKIAIDNQRFYMADLMNEVKQETMLTITSHHIVFAPVEPTMVDADKDKIGHVINNLISNAVKYSPGGSTIHIACVTIDSCAQVSVRDRGIGIHEKDIGRLFERYYRVESPGMKHISGFGIGLYLSFEIIRRHNGKIWVDSKPGKGSTFYFSLPLADKAE